MAVRDVVQAAAGVGGDKLYVEDVFSTYLYTGNGSTQTINNGIDLDGEGGLVWIKERGASSNHYLHDTERGSSFNLRSNATNAQQSTTWFTGFNSDGFDVASSVLNGNLDSLASWTSRKAPNFFDVVTYTGTGSTLTVPHSLGVIPGAVIYKSTSAAALPEPADWVVSHRSLPADYYLALNKTDSQFTYGSGIPINTATNLVISGGVNEYNKSGATYVAYLFAHDAGGFGDDGEQNVISCGSYTGNGSSTGPVVNLGWEPQWVMVKNASSTGDWSIFDNMRGMPATANATQRLKPNTADAESAIGGFYPTATGFEIKDTTPSINASPDTFIYIAIRRGPMKTPESGTEVYGVSYHPTTQRVDTGVKTDMMLFRTNDYAPGDSWFTFDRLRGGSVRLLTNTTDSESTGYLPTYLNMDFGYPTGVNNIGSGFASGYYVGWGFRRAPGFFDVTAHQSNGSPSQQINHNLGVVPEIVLIKSRNNDLNWFVFHKNLTAGYNLILNSTGAVIQSNTGTAAAFYDTYWTPGNNGVLSGGANTTTYIAYLFASVSGVSKVGSYTGTGTTLAIDCGFSAGARFVLIKRTDSTGDWYVWDTARGIVSGNDPYLLLNSTAAEVTGTDYIDPSSAGFEISSTAPVAINASGGSYIFLAIA